MRKRRATALPNLKRLDANRLNRPPQRVPNSAPGILSAHAVLVAAVCSLPHWVAIGQNGSDYSPFSVSPAVSALIFDETHAYAPPAQRFLSTARIDAEVDNYEHRKMSAGIPFIPEAVLGSMGKLLGGLGRAFVASDCVFPALLFVLLYGLTGPLVHERGLRLLIAWSSLVIPFGLLNSFWMGDDALLAPLELTRTPQPEISFLVLIGAVALLGQSLAKEDSWKRAIWAGVASGAVVYCYYFYAVAWALTLGLLLVFGLVWKSRLLWTRAAVALALMILLSAPFVIATLRGKAQGGQSFLLARMGAYTHRPNTLSLVAALALTIALVSAGRRLCRHQPVYFVLAVLVAGALYGMNFQILSGYETQLWHFWKRLALPVCFFLLTSFAARYAERLFEGKVKVLRVTAYLLLAALIAETAARLSYAAILTAPYHRASNPDVAMLSWVRNQLSPGYVLGTTDPELVLLIPALTANYTYVPSGLRSLTSTEEIVSRYFELACLLGLSPEQVERAAAVPDHLAHSTELLRALGLSYTGDPAVYRWLVDRYRQAHAGCSLPQGRLDFIITENASERAAVLSRHPGAQTPYRNARYELLDVRDQRPGR